MNWLNYHHLLYFWATAKYGSITRACGVLHLTPQTVSAQIRTLEKVVGEDLFLRVGRRLELTDTGRMVFRYADEIFSLGQELSEALRGHPTTRSVNLQVGMVDSLPKLIAHHVLEPVLELEQPVKITYHVGKSDKLLAELVTHELDVVISDGPVPAGMRIRAYNHLLGQCTATLLAAPKLAKKCRKNFPKSLDDMPFLLPAPESALYHSLRRWLDTNDVHPEILGEFADSAVVKVFGQKGAGVFAVPTVVEAEVRRQYRVQKIAELEGVVESFYALSVERKVRHPAVVAIYDAAREGIFAGG